MTLALNSAGSGTTDPILSGLGFEWVVAASTMDAATVTGPWIDPTNVFAGTNLVTTTPANSVVYRGTDAASDGAGTFTTTSPHGLVVGDYIYLSHASITAGIYKLLTVPTTTTFTLVAAGAPSNTVRSGISFEVAWRYQGTAGTSPSVAGTAASPTLNYYKATLADSAGNSVNQVDQNYIAAAPALSGTTYLAGDGKTLDGTQTTKQQSPSLAILSGWASHGGVSIVAFGTHSVQTSKTDFRHSDGTTGEKSLSTATTNGMNLTASDGIKYGSIKLKSIASAAIVVSQDIQITLDTLAPNVTFGFFGR